MESLQKAVYGCMQKLSLGIVWRELQVLSKLLYKGRNQHRRDKAFQMLLRVSKDLKKYQAVSLSNFVKKTWKSLLGSEVLSSVELQSISELLNKLVECAQFTAQMTAFIETTFNQVHLRFCMSLFIPFNLLMVSSLSRIWYCLRYHLHAISETFSIVKSHLPSNQQLSPADSILSCLPAIHQQYLNEIVPLSLDVPPSLGKGLGTAIPRLHYTDSEYKQPVAKTLSLATTSETVSTAQEQNAPILKTAIRSVSKFQKAPVVKKDPAKKVKRRKPNTIRCSIKVGKTLMPVRVHCPSYLKTAKLQTVYTVRLSHLKLLQKTPWQVIVTAHKVKLQPLSSKVKCCDDTRSTTCTKVHRKQVHPQNDIDDIFSVLNV